MQLFEQRENWELFAKDTRNKKALGNNGRRYNHKENAKMIKKILERQEQSELTKAIVEETTD